ncbi:MAG: Succinylglutamate desuccinylase/aspartoacylase [Proteobacteria bacterium]|nr:Succinylglutamate desuccinylase/aspartoacylase [Pseudomonadota bacterium]
MKAGKDRVPLQPYRIEVTFPDLARWQSGNSGIDHVFTLDSGLPGPHVMVNALTHGNEVCGAIVVDELLQRGIRPQRGKLTLAFANVAAYRRFDPADPDRARFIDEDFNRIWSASVLDGPRTSTELRRARALRPVINTVDYLLDLHSMHESCAPLLLSGPCDKGIDFARQLGFPAHIVVDAGHAQGCRLRDYAGFGDAASPKNALLVECGQHWEKAAVVVARQVTARFLQLLQVIREEALVDWLVLPTEPQQVIRVTDAVVANSRNFRFTEDYRGLEIIAQAGTRIATDGTNEIRTPYNDCVLIMPSLRQLAPGVTVVRFGKINTNR